MTEGLETSLSGERLPPTLPHAGPRYPKWTRRPRATFLPQPWGRGPRCAAELTPSSHLGRGPRPLTRAAEPWWAMSPRTPTSLRLQLPVVGDPVAGVLL